MGMADLTGTARGRAGWRGAKNPATAVPVPQCGRGVCLSLAGQEPASPTALLAVSSSELSRATLAWWQHQSGHAQEQPVVLHPRQQPCPGKWGLTLTHGPSPSAILEQSGGMSVPLGCRSTPSPPPWSNGLYPVTLGDTRFCQFWV